MSEIQNIEEWFVNHFGKVPGEIKADLEDAKARLTTLEGVALEYAQLGLDAAQRELASVQSAAPEVIAAAEAVVAKWQALLAKLEGA